MEELNEEEMKGTEGGACLYVGGEDNFRLERQSDREVRYWVADNVTSIRVREVTAPAGNQFELKKGEKCYTNPNGERILFSYMSRQFRIMRRERGFMGIKRKFEVTLTYTVATLPNQNEKTIASGRVTFGSQTRRRTIRITLP